MTDKPMTSPFTPELCEELVEALERCVLKLRRCATNAGNADFAVDAVCEPFEATLVKARGDA